MIPAEGKFYKSKGGDMRGHEQWGVVGHEGQSPTGRACRRIPIELALFLLRSQVIEVVFGYRIYLGEPPVALRGHS